jgi:hypothetical protein
MFNLPPPRHISTLPDFVSAGQKSPRKKPRAEVRGQSEVDRSVQEEQAQSAASLAQVRAPGERLPTRLCPPYCSICHQLPLARLPLMAFTYPRSA